MASVCNDPNGRKRILFFAPDGSRKTLRLGKLDKRTAEAIARHIDSLVSARIAGSAPPRDTAHWLTSIGDSLRDKLARAGLIDAPQRITLGEFLRDYVLNRKDVQPATLEVWSQPCRNLTEFFGADKLIASITEGAAEQFAQWLAQQPLAASTRAKRLSFARTFFHTARKHRLIDTNPFVEVKIPKADVKARQRFVDRETFERLLAVANPTWRTILALARLGGLRCPSEVLSLEWRHIDWSKDRITVPSPKTQRYAGKAERIIPLFAELRPYLEEAQELAEPGQTHVVGGDYLARANTAKGWRSINLRSELERLVRKAGLKPWPKLFHNLRSSRETELLQMLPLHVVAAWLGHDAKVCLAHYAQITEQHFEQAVRGPSSGAQRGAPSGAPSGAASECQKQGVGQC